MNLYRLLKIVTKIKSPRIKLFGLWGMHLFRRRYIGVFLDPVMACNLRCRMCYMSAGDNNVGASKNVTMDEAALSYIAETFFPHALKLQIGCATEPTLYKSLPNIVSEANKRGVPYISITTNGQLLTEPLLYDMIRNGLNEVTLSVHGFDKDIYEDMMRGARFDRFLSLLSTLKKAKNDYPEFKLRINYVINNDNVESLGKMFDVLDGLIPDVIQLRPIQKLGDSSYNDFSHDKIISKYEKIIVPIVDRCRKEGTICLAPSLDNLGKYTGEYDPMADYLEKATYYYLSPEGSNKKGLRWLEDSFREYHKREKTAQKMWKAIWRPLKISTERRSTLKLNYEIK